MSNDLRLPQQKLSEISTEPMIPTLDFSFISSPQDRLAIERDYHEVSRLFSAAAYKSAIVLCGSIAEAVLLGRLMGDEPQAKTQASLLKTRHHAMALDTWDLDELVKVSEAMGILGSDAVALANQLRNYRNIIHPGVEKRKDFDLTPGKAHAALSLLALIVEALG